jgi:hypothetical protein
MRMAGTVTETGTMNAKHYSDEEARKILKRAVDFQPLEEIQYSRDQLLEMGRDLGLSQDAIVKAEREHLAQRSLDIPPDEVEILFRQERQRGFAQHFMIFAVVMAVLIIVNIVTTGLDSPWFFAPFFCWGFAVLFHFFYVRGTSGEDYEEELDEWLNERENVMRKRQQRLAKQSGGQSS